MATINKDIPATIAVPHRVDKIIINLNEKTAVVEVNVEGKNTFYATIDLVPIVQAGTTTQKNTIKTFIRQILANAIQMALTDIPTDVLDIN